MSALDCTTELSNLLDNWVNERPTGNALISVLEKIADVFEQATEHYYKQDPDPFDDRHPSRSHPDCPLSHMLKKIFRNEEFISALLTEYMRSNSNSELSIASCRLLLDLLPGLDTTVLQETDGLFCLLIFWAERAVNPLRSYAVGVLAAAMENQDIAANYREHNACLVPVMLERLNDLSAEYFKVSPKKGTTERPFAHLSKESKDVVESESSSSTTHCFSESSLSVTLSLSTDPLAVSSSSRNVDCVNEHSSSSWSDMESLMIGTYQVYPLTLADEQRYILQYLASVGGYQELLTCIFEDPYRVLNLTLKYIDLNRHSNVRLAFDALKYLALLLCHKKCALEFISKFGIHHILKVHRQSVAATGVAFVLYYLAYNEDAMQKICLLSRNVVSDIVSYALWLLECSHASGRSHATMFFGLTFQFDIIRQLFAEQDGLRKLLNVVSTLDIVVLNVNRVLRGNLTAEGVLARRHVCRHACVTLKKLYEAHADSKASELRNSHLDDKNAHYSRQSFEENVETIVDLMPSTLPWEPVEQLVRLDGISLMLKLIVMHFDWSYSGKIETIKSALDVLYVCSVSEKVKLSICESVTYMNPAQTEQKKIGMSIVLQGTLGEVIADADVRRSALNVIVNCVCKPVVKESQIVDVQPARAFSRKKFGKNGDARNRIWNCVRSNDGIMILCSLLTIKGPVTDADAIRALACQALCGLAQCTKVMQIISKLPLVTSGQLQVLMKEPVLRDKRQEHAKFVKYCTRLIEMVAGRSVNSQINLNKAEIVAQTVITYKDDQLLYLVAEHLKKKGLFRSACALEDEAGLEPINIPEENARQETPNFRGKFATSKRLEKTFCGDVPQCSKTTDSSGKPCASTSCIQLESSCKTIDERHAATPLVIPLRLEKPSCAPGSSTRPLKYFACEPPQTRHSIELISPNEHNASAPITTARSSNFSNPSGLNQTAAPVKRFQKYSPSSGGYNKSAKRPFPLSLCGKRSVTLDSVVCEYLRGQHALCKNPYSTCPPFDLFTPHQCPEPRYQHVAPNNIALKFVKRQLCPSYWGKSGSRMMRKFLSTRFRDIASFQESEGNRLLSCAFSSTEEKVFVGTFSGEVRVFELYTGNEVYTYQCHETEISNIQFRKNCGLFLTSASWRRPVSALWDASQDFHLLYRFPDECYAEFSKATQDRIIGTKDERARVYDVMTGSLLLTLEQPNSGNSYTNNKATFNQTDELVLSDGVLWDVRSRKAIHKLDKFNPRINGVFHPNGFEIVSNSEIWDLRTYRLLRTVPELEQCEILFDYPGDVIYGTIIASGGRYRNHCYKKYGSSIRAFDASDYTCIATKDVQKSIFDIKMDAEDRRLSLILNYSHERNETSSCRVYEIGRSVEDDDTEGLDDDENQDMQRSDDADDNEEQEDVDEQDNDIEEYEEVTDTDDHRSSSGSDSVSDEEYYFSLRT